MAKKTVTVLMDKERHLRYGMNALIELEKVMGRPVTDLGDDLSMKDLRDMFFVGLKWEDKELTANQVGDLMDESLEENDFNYLSEKLTEAIMGALGQTALPKK